MIQILHYANIILTGVFLALLVIDIFNLGLYILAKEGCPTKDGFFKKLPMDNIILTVVFILNLIYLF